MAADDIGFNSQISQEEFNHFSEIIAQTVYPTPVEPARGRGLLGFDIGVAATAIPVDEKAQYWIRSVNSDILRSGNLVAPRLVVSKGIVFGSISASYAEIPNTSVKLYGASLDVPIIDGGLISPTLALRGSYAEIRGVDVFSLKTYGAELFLSKGFGPVTPYGAAGVARLQTTGRIEVPGQTPISLEDRSQHVRVTAGVRFSLVIPKIVIEATQAQDRVYSAKVSFGL